MAASMLARKPHKTAGSETIIGSSSMFIGSFSGDGNMTINGIVEGHINVEGAINVTSQGRVRAHIHAATCVIAGAITGKITALYHVIIEPTAKAWCDIKTNELKVAAGATFKGSCTE